PGDVVITKDVAIVGAGPEATTVTVGDPEHPVLTTRGDADHVRVAHLTASGAGGREGVVSVQGGYAELHDVVVEGFAPSDTPWARAAVDGRGSVALRGVRIDVASCATETCLGLALSTDGTTVIDGLAIRGVATHSDRAVEVRGRGGDVVHVADLRVDDA